MSLEFKRSNTERGFGLVEFQDAYGLKCSIQESSAWEPHIWLGVSDANPQIMNSDAAKLGLPTNGSTGWTEYQVPREVLMHTRMHLNKAQIIDLIAELQTYVENMPDYTEDA